MKTLFHAPARQLKGIATGFLVLAGAFTASAFEGHISATLLRGGEAQTFFYTVGTHQLRIERGESDHPHAKNIVSLDTGALTLVFPHNGSFMRLKPAAENEPATPPGFPALPAGLPPGIGPQSQPGQSAVPNGLPPGIGPTNLPGAPALPNPPGLAVPPSGLPSGFGAPALPPVIPAMPMMPVPMMEKMELKATGVKTNLLGFACEKYEIKQRGEIMEIWATDKLPPFQPWQPNQPPRFGPRGIEEQWGDLLKARKLFPLLAVLRMERAPEPAGGGTSAPSPERLRFEVKSVTPEKITDPDGKLFQAPPGYQEIGPLPF